MSKKCLKMTSLFWRFVWPFFTQNWLWIPTSARSAPRHQNETKIVPKRTLKYVKMEPVSIIFRVWAPLKKCFQKCLKKCPKKCLNMTSFWAFCRTLFYSKLALDPDFGQKCPKAPKCDQIGAQKDPKTCKIGACFNIFPCLDASENTQQHSQNLTPLGHHWVT